jgi:hypothetical protein
MFEIIGPLSIEHTLRIIGQILEIFFTIVNRTSSLDSGLREYKLASLIDLLRSHSLAYRSFLY